MDTIRVNDGQSGDRSRPHNTNGNGKSNSSATSLPQEDEARSAPIPRITDFMVLPNGTFIELVQPEGSPENEMKLLVWNGSNSLIVDYFDHEGRRLCPPRLDAKAYRNLKLCLPSGISTTAPSARTILDKICDCLHSFVDIPQAWLRLVVVFALSTWFTDKLRVAPYLWVTGPPDSGKTTLLRLLYCLCRRAVLIAGPIIGSDLFCLPPLLHPTLLFDELHLDGSQKAEDFTRWLRAGSSRGVPVQIGGQLVDPYGAKVLCSRQPLAETALASRAVHISMVPTRRTLVPLSEKMLHLISSAFQPLLLYFRLLHHKQFDPSEFVSFSRITDLAVALQLPFSSDPETTLTIVEALSDQDRDAQEEKLSEPEGLIIRALFVQCHKKEVTKVLAGRLAWLINAARKRVGEEADLKPRRVGAILKSLGFRTESLGSLGRGIQFTQVNRERIHDLIQAYGLEPVGDQRTAECTFCKERFKKKNESHEQKGSV